MPYVTKEIKEELLTRLPKKAGELNYLITKLLLAYVKENGKNYQIINDCLGALEGAKLEFYRRLAVDYEDIKIDENGDVYI
jgi:hypothetical protein